MNRRITRAGCLFTLLAACLFFPAHTPAQSGWLQKGVDALQGAAPAPGSLSPSQPSVGDVTVGLKDALRVGTETVVSQLGRPDGFNLNPEIHIPLPEKMRVVRDALKTVGKSAMLDDLEIRLNRAAELATPRAKELFLTAITAMTLDDAMAIYNGPEDAATRYFQKKLTPQLTEEMTPVVRQSLAETEAVRTYDSVMASYRAIPFVPDAKADLTAHVVDRGLAGIFFSLAREEAAIRRDPAKRTTDMLQKIFR